MSVDESQKACLQELKSLHADMKRCLSSENREKGANHDKVAEWKAIVQGIYKQINSIRRLTAMESAMHSSTVAIMREEMREELVQREAIAARTAERFRTFCSKGGPQIATAFDRAARTAYTIEQTVNALSCSPMQVHTDVQLLYDKSAAAKNAT